MRRDDASLTEAAATDVEAAFGAIVTTYAPAVYTTARRISAQPVDAEDLAAETFVRAYAALSGYAPDRIRALRLRPWLLTITLNLWRNGLRQASRRPALVPLDPGTPPPDAAAGPEQAALANEGAERLGYLLACLPERQRVAVVLRHVVGLPYADIAEVLGCKEGTAKSDVSRGLAALRARLRPPEEVGA